MPHTTPARTARHVVLGAVLATLALVASGCAQASSPAPTGTPDAAGSVPATITDAVAAGEAPVTEWFGPEEEFEPTPGKKVTILSCGAVASGCVLASEAAQEAAEAMGWEPRIIDGRLDPSVWNSAARQAATDQQDALILIATNPALLQDGLAQVQAAGIPTVVTFLPKFDDAPDLEAFITTDHAAGGTLLGQFIIADSEGAANTLVLDMREYPQTMRRNDALVAELEENCPNCTVIRQDFTPATMVERLAGQVASLLQQNPDVDYVFAPTDATSPFVAQGIRQAGKIDTVQLVSAEGAPDAFERITTGEQAATLAGSPGYVGWLAVDTAARLLAGEQPELTTIVPQRLLVQDNVADSLAAGSWPLEFDFRAKFLQLWGM